MQAATGGRAGRAPPPSRRPAHYTWNLRRLRRRPSSRHAPRADPASQTQRCQQANAANARGLLTVTGAAGCVEGSVKRPK
eukprot:gene16919-biopygen3823